MAAPCVAACSPWAAIEDVPQSWRARVNDDELFEQMLAVATDLLFQLSGRQYPGACSESVRPFSCRCLARPCSCAGVEEIELPNFPVSDVTEVKIDGAVLDPDLYAVHDFRYLVRLPNPDGTVPVWPRWQRLVRTSTEPDTFEVTYTWGLLPDNAGVHACKVLAYEMAKPAGDQGDECRLPDRVRSLTRQGVSMEIEGIADAAFPSQRTGIREVDLWLDAVNPQKITQRATIWSPDVDGHDYRRVTG